MNKSSRLVVVLAIATLTGGAYWFARGRPNAVPAATVPAPVPVVVATARSGRMPVVHSVVGRAEAYESVTLKSRLDGQVLAVDFVEGQAVKAGAPLVRLDPADWQARVAQAEALVARDQAQLAKARADVERYMGLKARGFVSDEKLNEVRSNEAALAASLKADQAALELARLQLSYTTVRAPFAGIVGARLVFPGSAVKTNDTALAVVNRVDPLYVGFALPERHLPALRRALRAGPLAVQVSLPGGGDAYAAKAHFVDNAVDPATGTVQVKAVLDNREARLTPGQFLNVGMVLQQLDDAVIVPNEAVQQGADGNFLYVVKGDGTVELRKLTIAGSHRGESAIAEGVAAGETVVTDGQLRLTPGAAVAAKPAKSGPASALEAPPK